MATQNDMLNFKQNANPTIKVWFSPNSKTATVICKYPHEKFMMSKWDLSTDEVVKGQWLTSKVLKVNTIKVSTDGKYIQYHIRDKHEPYQVYICTSEVPYWTAERCVRYDSAWYDGETMLVDKLPMTQSIEYMNKEDYNTHVLDYHRNKGKDTFCRDVHLYGGCIYVNDKLIADFTKDSFRKVAKE